MAAAAAFAVVRLLELLRTARATNREFGSAVEQVALAAEHASRKAEALESGSARFARSLARLEESLARLNILLHAYAEARASLAAVVLIPRK